MRDHPEDRFTITVEGVRHIDFHATAPDLDAAKLTAERVCTWSAHQGKRTIVTDRVPLSRETKSIFGGTRTITEYPVVWSATSTRADYGKARAA